MQNFQPSDWIAVASYYCGTNEISYEIMCEETEGAKEVIRHGLRHPDAHSLKRGCAGDLTGVCDHCGASHAWGVVIQEAVGDRLMTIGHQCAETLIGSAIEAFSRQRADTETEASIRRKRRAQIRQGITQLADLLRKHPTLAAWLRTDDAFAKSLRSNLAQGGWSFSQISAAVAASKRADDGSYRFPLLQPAATAPIGRTAGEFRILAMKRVDSGWGEATKGMLVEAVAGWTCWTTIPHQLRRGDTLKGTITLKPSDRPTHAWGSRPKWAA